MKGKALFDIQVLSENEVILTGNVYRPELQNRIAHSSYELAASLLRPPVSSIDLKKFTFNDALLTMSHYCDIHCDN